MRPPYHYKANSCTCKMASFILRQPPGSHPNIQMQFHTSIENVIVEIKSSYLHGEISYTGQMKWTSGACFNIR